MENTKELINEFIIQWGQSHLDLCANLGYDEEDSDDIIMLDYFFYFDENRWIPKHSSMYSEEEQEFADKLRLL